MVTGVFSIPNQQTTAGDGSLPAAVPLLVGPENRLLAPAVNHLVNRQTIDQVYNPLVLYGPVGCGLVPVARALAAAYCRHRPDASVCWFDAEPLSAKIARRSDRLRHYFVTAPIVVIHEIERFGGKLAAQAALQQWIDQRAVAGQQLLVTATAAPGALEMLIPTLRSRLTAGLVLSLAQPRLATRLATVLAYAEAIRLPITSEAAELLARRVDRSWDDLVAAVKGLATSRGSAPSESPLDATAVRIYLGERPKTTRLTLAQITTQVARYFDIPTADLRGRSRRRAVATARSVTMYLARETGQYSLQTIGKYLGNRDHTTVLHSCRKVVSLLAEDPAVRQAVCDLRQTMQATT